MADWLNEYIGQLKDIWKKLNKRVKIVITFGVFAVLFAFILLMFYGGEQYQPLFSQLDPRDADSIMERLEEQGVQYQLADGGKTIMVPASTVYKTRLDMAGEGLPTQGVVGFEIFDQSSFGTTDFERRVNYYRALSGELSRSIQAMDVVEYAKVQITAPKDSLFVEEEQSAEASVLLKMIPNFQINEAQVRAIANLVASAVQGMAPEGVTIVDTSGNLLTRYLKDKTDLFGQELTMNQFEIQRQFAEEIRRDLRAMLTRVLGPDNFSVQVKAKLNFDQRQVESKVYTPVVDEQGIIRSQQEKKENYEGALSPATGVPGTTSNLPQYQSVDEEEGSGSYSSSDVITNFEINEKIERHIYSPGGVEYLSVAVIINNLLPEEDIDKIENAIQTAIGYNPERGDQVTVTSLAFDDSLNEDLARFQAAEASAQRTRMLINAGLIALILLILIITIFIFRRRMGDSGELHTGKQAIDYIIDEDLKLEIAAADMTEEQKRRIQIREQLTELVNEKPEEVTQMIKSWLVDE